MKQKADYMKVALKLAKKALKNGDIPIGAVIVNAEGEIIGSGYNKKEKDQNAVNHAEILAIKQACQKTGSWRLENCTIYSTLEPCLMCFGAIIQARIGHIVFALTSEKFGCIETLSYLKVKKKLNHYCTYTYSHADESRIMLQSFFSKLRD